MVGRDHVDIRWNFIDILHTSRGRDISVFEAAILDFQLPFARDGSSVEFLDLENGG